MEMYFSLLNDSILWFCILILERKVGEQGKEGEPCFYCFGFEVTHHYGFYFIGKNQLYGLSLIQEVEKCSPWLDSYFIKTMPWKKKDGYG